MNQQESTDQALLRFQTIAAQYTPQSRTRNRALLEPITESIRTLREKGASFATISELLKRDQVNVSRFVIARFCRKHLADKRGSSQRNRRLGGK